MWTDGLSDDELQEYVARREKKATWSGRGVWVCRGLAFAMVGLALVAAEGPLPPRCLRGTGFRRRHIRRNGGPPNAKRLRRRTRVWRYARARAAAAEHEVKATPLSCRCPQSGRTPSPCDDGTRPVGRNLGHPGTKYWSPAREDAGDHGPSTGRLRRSLTLHPSEPLVPHVDESVGARCASAEGWFRMSTIFDAGETIAIPMLTRSSLRPSATTPSGTHSRSQ